MNNRVRNMERFIYRALLKDGAEDKAEEYIQIHSVDLDKLLEKNVLMTLSVFRWRRNLFLYYECIGEHIIPEEMFPKLNQLLEIRPDEGGSKAWIPMIDIFHFSRPVSVEHWRRKKHVEKRVGMIARIKPDMMSSYIYYHYMLQEEQPDIVNKYCIIGLDENLIFYYEEQPTTKELPQYKGKLNTSNLSPDWQKGWQELMEPHFILWEDVPLHENKLRQCKVIYSI
jgi:L-rhamnose mutarotase